jgi:hypothetical protein
VQFSIFMITYVWWWPHTAETCCKFYMKDQEGIRFVLWFSELFLLDLWNFLKNSLSEDSYGSPVALKGVKLLSYWGGWSKQQDNNEENHDTNSFPDCSPDCLQVGAAHTARSKKLRGVSAAKEEDREFGSVSSYSNNAASRNSSRSVN